MKKNILILSFVFSGLLAWSQETSRITLGATPLQSTCSVSPTQGDMLPVKFDVTFVYDQSKEMVTLQMIMRSSEYSHVWIPPLQESCLQQTKKDFKLFRTTRLFRKGIDQINSMKGITSNNSRMVDVMNCGLYEVDDTIQVLFYLQNQDVDSFFITINNIVPIKDKKSFFGLGKLKHHYMYFGGPIRWEIALNRNPCIMPHNIAMHERVENLKKEAKKVERTLKVVKGKECQACKEQRIPPLIDSLQQIQRQIDRKHLCVNLETDLDTVSKMISRLSNHQCIEPPVCTGAMVSKHIKRLGDAKEKLDSITDQYIVIKRQKNKKALSQVVEDGEKLIYETNTYYEKQILSECKKRKEVATAWSGYTKIRDAFKNRTKK